MGKLSIKDAAKILNVSEQTIRLYEKKNFIFPSRNVNNNYREYSPEQLIALYKIIKLNRLGFPLNSIATFVNDNSKDSIEVLNIKIKEIRENILFQMMICEYMEMMVNDCEYYSNHISELQEINEEMVIYYQYIDCIKSEMDSWRDIYAIADIGIILNSSEEIDSDAGELAYMISSRFFSNKELLENNDLNLNKLVYRKFVQVFVRTATRNSLVDEVNKWKKYVEKNHAISKEIITFPVFNLKKSETEEQYWKVIFNIID